MNVKKKLLFIIFFSNLNKKMLYHAAKSLIRLILRDIKKINHIEGGTNIYFV